MTTSIRSEARRNQSSILIRGRENHVSPKPDGQTYISIVKVASLLKYDCIWCLSLSFFNACSYIETIFNDNIHKNEVQEIRWILSSCKYYRISYYIENNHPYRIIIPKFMEKKQLFFHVKINMFIWTNRLSVHNYPVDALSNCIRNHHTKFDIDRVILTCLNF